MVNPYASPKNSSAPVSADQGKLEVAASRLVRIGTVLCGLLVVAILITTVWILKEAIFGGGEDMSAGFTFLIFIPLASIPVGLICLAGAICCGLVSQRQSSSKAESDLRLAINCPVAVLVLYFVCLVIVLTAG
jgi:hypothetical protein